MENENKKENLTENKTENKVENTIEKKVENTAEPKTENLVEKKEENTTEKKTKKKIKRRIKNKLNAYNIAIIVCVVLIIISAIILFVPKGKKDNNTSEKTSKSIFSKMNDISEDKAREKAVKKFKELGENDVTKDSIQVVELKRQDGMYYYISSAKNTLEIRIDDGHITRINSVVVDEK